MKRYALIKDGAVQNIALWDGLKRWSPGAGITLVDVNDKPEVAVGWVYQGGNFTNPNGVPSDDGRQQ